MNNNKSIEPYKEEVINAIDEIASFTNGMDMISFIKDRKTYNATMMDLALIGELVSKIPEDIRLQSTTTPWGDIIGLRNRIAHDYFSLDEKVLWKTIVESLPKLRVEIQKLHD